MGVMDFIRGLRASNSPMPLVQQEAMRFYETFSPNGFNANVSAFTEEQLARIYALSTTAYACTNYRARTTGGTPIMLADASGEKQTDAGNLAWWLTKNPSRGLQLEWITRSILLFGHAYLRKQYNFIGGRRGLPTGLSLYNPLTVVPIYKNGMGTVEAYRLLNEDGSYDVIPASEMVYIQDYDPDPYGVGLSKFEVAWHNLRVDENISKYAAAFFFNGARPDGIVMLESILSPSAIDKMSKDWERMFSKSNNAHKTAFLPTGVKYTPITSSVKDLDISALSDTTRVNICITMEVAPVLIGLKMAADSLSSSSTFGASEVAHILSVTIPFLNNTVLTALNEQWLPDLGMGDYQLKVDEHKIRALNEQVIRELLAGSDAYRRGVIRMDELRLMLGMPIDTDGLLRAADEPLALYQAGSITRNEMRKLIGLDEMPDDVVMITGKVYPVDRVAELANANVEAALAPKPSANAPTDPTPPDKPFAPAPVEKPAIENMPDKPAHPRSEMVREYQFAFQFNDNQFAKSAMRKAMLATQGAIIEWQSGAFVLPVLSATGTTPELVRMTDQLNTGMLSAPTLRSEEITFGERIELRFDDALDEFTTQLSAVLSMFDVQIQPSVQSIVLGVGRCDCSPIEAEYPFVGVKMTLYSDGDVVKTWQLKQNNANVRSELKKWGEKAIRRGATVHFEPEYLEGTPVLSFLSYVLPLVENTDTEGVFSLAQDIALGENTWRSWDNTQQWFTDTLASLIRQGLGSEISQKKFAGQIKVALRMAGLRAFQDGFEFAKAPRESYSPEEVAAFKAWLAEQSQYVTQFANEVYKEGLAESEIDSRCQKWANKSLRAAYHLAMELAGNETLYRWRLGATEEHCSTCGTNSGLIRSLKDWKVLGLPQSDMLECKGYNCDCSLENI